MAWAPDYITLAEAKANLRIPADDTQDDADLALHITAASRNIDRFADRQFGQVDEVTDRFYAACWDRDWRTWVVHVDDIHDAADLEVAYDGAGDHTFATELAFTLGPLSAPADGKPYEYVKITGSPRLTAIPDGVRVRSAGFGWDAVPKPVKDGVHLQVNRFRVRRDSPYGVAGSPELGTEMRLLNKLDPDVEVMVRPYQRYWAAV